MKVNSLGKWKTACQMVGLSALLAFREGHLLLGSHPASAHASSPCPSLLRPPMTDQRAAICTFIPISTARYALVCMSCCLPSHDRLQAGNLYGASLCIIVTGAFRLGYTCATADHRLCICHSAEADLQGRHDVAGAHLVRRLPGSLVAVPLHEQCLGERLTRLSQLRIRKALGLLHATTGPI